VAVPGELDAHAAGELVAGDDRVDGIALGRAAHGAAGVVDALVPRALDLAALVGDLEQGVHLVVIALAMERLGDVAARHFVVGRAVDLLLLAAVENDDARALP